MHASDLIRHVDEQHRLHAELPPNIQTGPVKLTPQPATEDEDADWRALINQSWSRDWNDPCEDIYTLEDGTPK